MVRLGGRLLVALAALLAACGAPPKDAAWPQGLLLSARTPALAGLLDGLTDLEGTPLGRLAAVWRAALPACEEVEAVAAEADPHALLAALRCADPKGPLAVFRAERGAHDLAFAWPGAPGRRITGHADLDGAGGHVELRWPALEGPLADLLPGDEPAGPDRLAAARRVAHARARSAGPLDLAAWVPSGSQGDRLFHLRDRLLSSALLDGSVELALYQPEPGAAMPQSALALGVRQPEAARAAAEHFLEGVAAAWRLRRAPFASGDASGACLPDLHVVPELAPCYALTGDALVLGWNADSLRHALGSDAANGSGAPTAAASADAALPARFDVDLDRLRAADLALAARQGREAAPLRWPWQSLRATAQRQAGSLEVLLTLVPERAS